MNAQFTHQPFGHSELLANEATLSDRQMSDMNFAREEFAKLEWLLRRFVIPAIGDYENPICHDLDRHIEHIRDCSGNFFWKYRDLGSSYDAKDIDSASQALLGRSV